MRKQRSFPGTGKCNSNPMQGSDERDARVLRLNSYVRDYFHPVLALEDGAYIRIFNGNVEIMKGSVWKLDGYQVTYPIYRNS